MFNARMMSAVAVIGTLAATPAVAEDNFWLGAKGGTLGLGVEATWTLVPFLDLRAGGNGFDYDTDGSQAGIDYDADLQLQSFYATANLRMPLSPFRLTTGLFSNGNELSLVSRDTSSFEIGSMTYTAGQVGSLAGTVDFDDTAPYLGLGADFRVANRFAINLDLGVLLQGSPRVGLLASGPIASDPIFQAELEAERLQLEDDLEDFKLYPVGSVGFSWNF